MRLPESLALFCGEPVTETHSEFRYPFDAADSSYQIGTEHNAVGRLVGKAPHRTISARCRRAELTAIFSVASDWFSASASSNVLLHRLPI
jgi:hypothetical protein